MKEGLKRNRLVDSLIISFMGAPDLINLRGGSECKTSSNEGRTNLWNGAKKQ